MTTGDEGRAQNVGECERRILQALCQGTAQGSIREMARDLLRSYRWHEALHEAIYEVVLGIPCESTEVIRLQLPARLTRRGFPDFDLEIFFRPHGLSKVEVEGLIQQVLGA